MPDDQQEPIVAHPFTAYEILQHLTADTTLDETLGGRPRFKVLSGGHDGIAQVDLTFTPAAGHEFWGDAGVQRAETRFRVTIERVSWTPPDGP